MAKTSRTRSRGVVSCARLEQAGIGRQFAGTTLFDLNPEVRPIVKRVLRGELPWFLFIQTYDLEERYRVAAVAIKHLVSMCKSGLLIDIETVARAHLDRERDSTFQHKELVGLDIPFDDEPNRLELSAVRRLILARHRLGKSTFVLTHLPLSSRGSSIETLFGDQVHEVIKTHYKQVRL